MSVTQITITEALAELNTISKRVLKKKEFVNTYLARPEGLKDPLEKAGGSVKVLREELQAIKDLLMRHVSIRIAIQRSNQETPITVGGTTKSVAEWLTWRKEVAPSIQTFNATMRHTLDQTRRQAQQRGAAVVSASVSVAGDAKPTDFVVNVDEAELNADAETLENILGTLDGQLSLKNATVTISI